MSVVALVEQEAGFQAYTPAELRKIRSYERKVNALVGRGLRTQAADLRRIRLRFNRFRADALALLPERYAMNQEAIRQVLDQAGRQLQALTTDVSGIVRSGIENGAELGTEVGDLFSRSFLDDVEQITLAGVRVQQIDLAADFSAELIGLRRGGLGARMLGEVNRVLRLAALGAGAGAFNAAGELWRAMGGAGRWAWQAERIYRTEVLRMQSLATQQSIMELNEHVATHKRWKWSGIDRREHAQIDGQTVAARARFAVPVREGGTVKMRFPRDPGAPPSATINCGCYVIPVPAPGRKRRRRRPPAPRPRPRPRPPRRPPPAPPVPPAPRPSRRAARPTSAAAREKAARAKLKGLAEEVQVIRGLGKAEAIEALERMANEYDRLVKRYPGLKDKRLWRLSARRGAGGVHYGRWGGARPGVPIARIEVGRFDSGHFRTWVKQRTVTIAGKRERVSIRWNTAREGHDVEDIFRHEWGHAIDLDVLDIQGAAGRNALAAEWDEILEEFPLRGENTVLGERYPGATSGWWGRNVSEYSTHIYGDRQEAMSRAYGWRKTQGGTEAWAELFARVTQEDYVEGTLPKRIEDFAKRVLQTEKLGG